MDNELFELCKEVYKRFPEWETGEWTNESGDYVNPASDLIEVGIHFPLYTSDYLLEKLPKEANAGDITLRWRSDTGWENWEAGYMNLRYVSDTEWHSSDTPLKALLKLVLALDDAGVKL